MWANWPCTAIRRKVHLRPLSATFRPPTREQAVFALSRPLATGRSGLPSRTRSAAQLAAPVTLLVLAFAAAARAGVECPEPMIQAGAVRSGTPLGHAFRLLNRGSRAVEITEVRPSCGCLVPHLEPRRIEPGAEAVLHVAVNTLTQAAGAHTWQVRVRYQEDGRPGELTVVLGARVVSEIAVEPPAMVLTTEGPFAHEVVLTDRRPQPLTITSVQLATAQLHARAGEPYTDGAGRRACAIRVEVGADCPEGRHEDVLRIFTNDPTYRELDVPVTVVKRSVHAVRALPEAVELSAPAGEPLPSRIVLLSSADGRPVVVEGVEADNPAIECRFAAGPGPRATLEVRVKRAQVPGDGLRGAIRIRLSRPAPQTVVVPVSCTVR